MTTSTKVPDTPNEVTPTLDPLEGQPTAPPTTEPPPPTPTSIPSPTPATTSTPEKATPTPTPLPEDPWDDPDYWLESSPLDVVLDMDQAPDGPHFEVVLCRSTVGYGTDMTCQTLAHTISSLDVFVYPTGLILLGGLNMVDFDYLEYGAEYLNAITTPDLERFGTHLWHVENTTSPFLTDASLEELADGTIRAVYFSGMASEVGEHTIRAAYRQGETWSEWPEALYVNTTLLDPKTCMYDGINHLFATQDASSIVHATGIDPYHYYTEPTFSWEDCQVPFCFTTEGGQFWLVGQSGGGWGPPWVRVLRDDNTFSDPVELWSPDDYPELDSCTSPVLAKFLGYYLVFCAIHR